MSSNQNRDGYVIFNKETTKLLNGRIYTKFNSAYEALINRCKEDKTLTISDWRILSKYEFSRVEKKKIVKNFKSNTEVEIGVNTPHSCDPSNETYWGM